MNRIAVVLLCACVGCELPGEKAQRLREEKYEEEVRNGACWDTATLLATTAGSPSTASCSNKKHRMRVQVASQPSNEEFGAVVHCECVDKADASP